MRTSRALFISFSLLLSISLGVMHIYRATAQGEPSAELPKQDKVWGVPYKDIAISVTPKQREYVLGQDIPVTVTLKNVGEKTLQLALSGGEDAIYRDYRVALFQYDGQAAAKSQKYLDYEKTINPSVPEARAGSRLGVELAPGQEYLPVSININDWFAIEKEGTYSLVVMRRLWAWNYGFAISNLTPITVVKGGEDASRENK